MCPLKHTIEKDADAPVNMRLPGITIRPFVVRFRSYRAKDHVNQHTGAAMNIVQNDCPAVTLLGQPDGQKWPCFFHTMAFEHIEDFMFLRIDLSFNFFD
ncbi:hypothetical protein [Beijerinckia indica]|uniref:hypothetical protein n=1 Tax=Beijerinckia indica TaxID=533 RepID=UPI0005A04439|nr:hypothetical protein [Beijerinckia indica]